MAYQHGNFTLKNLQASWLVSAMIACMRYCGLLPYSCQNLFSPKLYCKVMCVVLILCNLLVVWLCYRLRLKARWCKWLLQIGWSLTSEKMILVVVLGALFRLLLLFCVKTMNIHTHVIYKTCCLPTFICRNMQLRVVQNFSSLWIYRYILLLPLYTFSAFLWSSKEFIKLNMPYIQVPGSTTYTLALYYMMDTPIENAPLLESFVKGDDAFRNSRFKLIPYISKVCILIIEIEHNHFFTRFNNIYFYLSCLMS